jgi:3-hydroxyacyl-[acyl-carrier-protein] dehydratase
MGAPDPIVAGEFFFDPEDLIYPDHFPGNPVVPGSLIIEAFMRIVMSVVESGGKLWAVENFRFRQFIPPGRYAFRVTGKSDGAMQCVLYDDGRKVVTGILSGSDCSC